MTRGVSVSENSANIWEISNRRLDNCKRSEGTKPSGKLFAAVTNGPEIGPRPGTSIAVESLARTGSGSLVS